MMMIQSIAAKWAMVDLGLGIGCGKDQNERSDCKQQKGRLWSARGGAHRFFLQIGNRRWRNYVLRDET